MAPRKQRLREMASFIYRLFSIMPYFDPLILHSFTPLYPSLFAGKREMGWQIFRWSAVFVIVKVCDQ